MNLFDHGRADIADIARGDDDGQSGRGQDRVPEYLTAEIPMRSSYIPPTGRYGKPNCLKRTANTTMSIRPSQKVGMAMPTKLNPVTAWSSGEYCRTALRMPSTKTEDKDHRVGDADEEQRVRQSLQHHVEDVLACVVRRSPVSGEHVPEPRQVLDRYRLVETVVMAEARDILRRQRGVDGVGCQGVAGRLHQHEPDEGDDEQQRHGLDEAPRDVGDQTPVLTLRPANHQVVSVSE